MVTRLQGGDKMVIEKREGKFQLIKKGKVIDSCKNTKVGIYFDSLLLSMVIDLSCQKGKKVLLSSLNLEEQSEEFIVTI